MARRDDEYRDSEYICTYNNTMYNDTYTLIYLYTYEDTI